MLDTQTEGESGTAPARAQLSLSAGLAVKDAAAVERHNTEWHRKRQVAPVKARLWGKRADILKRALLLDRSAWAHVGLSLGWRLGLVQLESDEEPPAPDRAYQDWIERYDQLSSIDFEMISMHLATTTFPHVSAHVSVGEDVGQVEGALRGLVSQKYPHWNACLYVSPRLDPVLLESIRTAARIDPRIEVQVAGGAGPISRPRAGACMLVMDAAVVLRPHAFYSFAEKVLQEPGARVIYSDEDEIDDAGVRSNPVFKPSFSPEFNRRVAYLGSCAMMTAGAEDAAGFEPLSSHLGSGGTVAEWIAAVVSELRVGQVAHVPHILFHRRSTVGRPTPRDIALRARDTHESVAVIIPTKNHADLVKNCIASLEQTQWPEGRLEIIIVDNGSDDPATLGYLQGLQQSGGRVRVIRDPRPFNYSQLNNTAASQTSADLLVFLNNDTEALTPSWLAEMADAASAEDVAIVGCKLVYPDRTVQHGGVALGVQGVAAHAHVGMPADEGGYLGLANLTREMTALTGACIAVRHSVFREIGGFDESLPIAFNDTALCLRAIQLGYRNLYVGRALFVHHESKTRGVDETPEKLETFRRECIYVRQKHMGMFQDDPSYNPNLSLERVHALGAPRARQPWSRFRKTSNALPRVLLLSVVHGVGHGVAVVLQQHAQYLARRGFQVFVGGPLAQREIRYQGCYRVYFDTETEAAAFALEAEMDCVMAHTMPFFGIPKFIGAWPRSIIYDHGEPKPEWFEDADERRRINTEKRFFYRLASLVLTISDVIKEESGFERAGVLTHGNSHLATWDPARTLSRPPLRERLGFSGSLVVLNVCRFHEGERRYKGLDEYIGVMREVRRGHPDLKVRFVLCGKGTADDRRAMREAGLEVFANVSDSELIDMYVAADLYMNFSKWEGYNLGIGQALALGLPVMASDIPAHRKFPIKTSDRLQEQVEFVVSAASRHQEAAERKPIILGWDEPLKQLERTIIELCRAE